MISLLAALALSASSPNSPPARTGECKWIHGRYAIYNGSSLRRIWPIGTNRIIALDDEDQDIPPEMERYQAHNTEHYGFADALFGDFYVCAREPSRPGHMQHVRLVRTRNLIFRGRPYR
jgi:hypothetical protein